MKTAKLVYTSFVHSIIIDDTETEEQIMEKARIALIEKLNHEGISEHIEKIIDDEEMPCASDVYYQPDFTNPETGEEEIPIDIDGQELHSFEVYEKKSNAQIDFPNHKILEYSGQDIENPTFKD